MSSRIPSTLPQSAANENLPKGAESTVILKDLDILERPYALRRPSHRGHSVHAAMPASDPAVSTPVSSDFRAMDRSESNSAVDNLRSFQTGYDEGYAAGQVEERKRAEAEVKARAEEHIQQAVKLALREVEKNGKTRLEKALEAMQSLQKSKLGRLDELLNQVSSQIDMRLLEAEDDLLTLVHDVICRIMGAKALEPEYIVQHIRSAASELSVQRIVAIHLHPEDLRVFEHHRAELTKNFKASHINGIASKDVQLGGCILQTSSGGFDARFETQLQILRDTLTAARLQRSAPVPARESAHAVASLLIDSPKGEPEGRT